MCHTINNLFSSPIFHTIDTTIVHIDSFIKECAYQYCSIQRTVTVVSEKWLPKPISYIVKRAFQTLPCTLTIAFLPANISALVLTSYFVIPRVHATIIPKNIQEYIGDSLGFAFSAASITNVIRFTCSGNSAYFLAAVIHTLAAWYIFDTNRERALECSEM